MSIVESRFPPGTPVCVREVTRLRDDSYEAETIGVVESWSVKPTGSWYAHGKDKRLWLRRLTLRKPDGELTQIVVDDYTYIAKLEAK